MKASLFLWKQANFIETSLFHWMLAYFFESKLISLMQAIFIEASLFHWCKLISLMVISLMIANFIDTSKLLRFFGCFPRESFSMKKANISHLTCFNLLMQKKRRSFTILVARFKLLIKSFPFLLSILLMQLLQMLSVCFLRVRESFSTFVALLGLLMQKLSLSFLYKGAWTSGIRYR